MAPNVSILTIPISKGIPLSCAYPKAALTPLSGGAGFDYIFKDFGEIMPFVGLQASYVKSKIDDTDLKDLGIDSLSGINLGINAGMIFPVMDSVEIEVGLRLLELELQNSVTKGTTQYEVELDGGTQYYLGVNYKF